MSLLGFGQPQTGVFQMAYVVEDIDASMRRYDKPSVYREAIERQGYGFHHFGVGSLDYDADLARHLEQGHDLAFEAWVPTGGRVGYVDTTAELPGYVELIEMDAATDATFTRFYAASLTWDGSDPVRPFA